jgi:hypothetical protein
VPFRGLWNGDRGKCSDLRHAPERIPRECICGWVTEGEGKSEVSNHSFFFCCSHYPLGRWGRKCFGGRKTRVLLKKHCSVKYSQHCSHKTKEGHSE